MTTPATYADWAALLRRFKEGGSDDEVLAAMRAGTIVWQSGVAERFVMRLTDAVNARMNAATDAFDRVMGRARDESEVIAALLGLRRAEHALQILQQVHHTHLLMNSLSVPILAKSISP